MFEEPDKSVDFLFNELPVICTSVYFPSVIETYFLKMFFPSPQSIGNNDTIYLEGISALSTKEQLAPGLVQLHRPSQK